MQDGATRYCRRRLDCRRAAPPTARVARAERVLRKMPLRLLAEEGQPLAPAHNGLRVARLRDLQRLGLSALPLFQQSLAPTHQHACSGTHAASLAQPHHYTSRSSLGRRRQQYRACTHTPKHPGEHTPRKARRPGAPSRIAPRCCATAHTRRATTWLSCGDTRVCVSR